MVSPPEAASTPSPERRLRILMAAYSCAPNRGSELANGWNWPVSMARRGHDVTVITTPRFRDEILSAARCLPFPSPTFEFVDDSVSPSPWSRGQVGVYAKYLSWQKRIVERSTELQRTRAFDLVHHVSWTTLQGGSRLDALGVPFIFGPVGGGQVAPLRFLAYFGKSAFSELVRSFFATTLAGTLGNSRAAVNRASIVLAANRETHVLAKRLGGRSVAFFQDTGIESSLLEGVPNRAWSDPVLQLVWVGRLFPRKGLRIALEALAQLPDGIPVRLTIVGDGPERERLMATATSLGVGDLIDWRGQVPWRDALAAMDGAHVLLFTSLRDSGGAQLLEAQARALPVITLNHQGAAVHVQDDSGIKITVSTPRQVVKELATAIARVHSDRSLLARASKSAGEWAAAQTWDAKALRMESVYHRALGVEAEKTDP